MLPSKKRGQPPPYGALRVHRYHVYFNTYGGICQQFVILLNIVFYLTFYNKRDIIYRLCIKYREEVRYADIRIQARLLAAT